jgi:hypothetical protein
MNLQVLGFAGALLQASHGLRLKDRIRGVGHPTDNLGGILGVADYSQ